MEPPTLNFREERETKNTVRYEEQTAGKPPAIGTLYVQKTVARREPAGKAPGASQQLEAEEKPAAAAVTGL